MLTTRNIVSLHVTSSKGHFLMTLIITYLLIYKKDYIKRIIKKDCVYKKGLYHSRGIKIDNSCRL